MVRSRVSSAELAIRAASKSVVDPALALRVKGALERLTGLDVRVGAAKVELAYDDEHDLEQLAGALESRERTSLEDR